jgi:hypothetical protein
MTTLLKYPASITLWERLGSKKEKSRFISSSSSTKVLRITSISQVKTSEEMKGNLIEKYALKFMKVPRNIPKNQVNCTSG